MVCGVVLMVGLCGIEGFQRDDLRHDPTRKNFGLFELRYIGLGDPFLLFATIENGRSILTSLVGSLSIQLRRIVRHREEDAQDLAVRNFRWVVGDFD